jgi:hypothetical protein
VIDDLIFVLTDITDENDPVYKLIHDKVSNLLKGRDCEKGGVNVYYYEKRVKALMEVIDKLEYLKHLFYLNDSENYQNYETLWQIGYSNLQCKNHAIKLIEGASPIFKSKCDLAGLYKSRDELIKDLDKLNGSQYG